MLTQKISHTQIADVKHLFEICKNVVIVTHTSADGDAIGSSLGLYEYLKKKGKDVRVIVPNFFPDFLKWMNDADKIIQFDHHKAQAKMYIERADLIICLDLNALSRMEEVADFVVKSTAKKIMIDHHLGPEKFCDVILSYHTASSTSELVFRVIDAIGGLSQLTKAGAEDLYAGMCTDTGRFSYNSNDPDIFIIISELLKKGIDKDKIIRDIYNNYTEGRYRLLGYILSEKLNVLNEYHAAFYTLSREELSRFNYIKGDTEGVVNMPLEIKGIKLSVSLREDTDKPRVLISLRSVDDFPANKMAEEFFCGGGHLNAAGGQLSCSLDEAVEQLHKALEAYKDKLSE